MRALAAAVADARRSLRVRRRRALLTAAGITLAAAMLSAAVVVADGLGLGFDRAASTAGLPDVIVRFDPISARRIATKVASLPDIAGYALRQEVTNVGIGFAGRRRGDAVAEVVSGSGRRGYAVVGGRDLSTTRPEVLIERAFAQSWAIRLGDTFFVQGLGPETVAGFVEAPDNVGFPLAKPRFYISRRAIDAEYGAELDPEVNLAEIWLRNPRYVSEVLAQARTISLGLHDIRFATRAGLRVLLDQAAGIVIDLLVALSAIALLTAGVMLGASARAEVQRRLPGLGVRRAVGATPGYVSLVHGLEALAIAAPAAAVDMVAGVLATAGPTGRLLTLLNEPAPAGGLALPLAAAFVGATAIPVATTVWPVWRAARRPVVTLLRSADVSAVPRGRIALRGAGLTLLGARLVAARRARLFATVVTLGHSTAFVLLMLALASALATLETDPSALGKRYQLTASLPPQAAPEVSAIAGVQAAAPRYELSAADSFSLGETIDVIAYAADHTLFEAPALVSGHRLRGTGEAEVGAGLADALGLSQGSLLALALPSETELPLRVAGIVSSLDHDGRVAYVSASSLTRADPSARSQIAIRLVRGADQGRVSAALTALGAQPAQTRTATARGAPLVDVLRMILRAIAVVDVLVCLYALIQSCTLTIQERCRTVAVFRACGAGPPAVRQLLAGAALALVVPSAVAGVLLERLAFGPALAHLAAGYATLPLRATAAEVLATVAGLGIAAVVAVLWVARRAGRESVVAGLGA